MIVGVSTPAGADVHDRVRPGPRVVDRVRRRWIRPLIASIGDDRAARVAGDRLHRDSSRWPTSAPRSASTFASCARPDALSRSRRRSRESSCRRGRGLAPRPKPSPLAVENEPRRRHHTRGWIAPSRRRRQTRTIAESAGRHRDETNRRCPPKPKPRRSASVTLRRQRIAEAPRRERASTGSASPFGRRARPPCRRTWRSRGRSRDVAMSVSAPLIPRLADCVPLPDGRRVRSQWIERTPSPPPRHKSTVDPNESGGDRDASVADRAERRVVRRQDRTPPTTTVSLREIGGEANRGSGRASETMDFPGVVRPAVSRGVRRIRARRRSEIEISVSADDHVNVGAIDSGFRRCRAPAPDALSRRRRGYRGRRGS